LCLLLYHLSHASTSLPPFFLNLMEVH
jgi:hypothetical protein